MRQTLIRLFRSPGWVELPNIDWKQLQPYVDRHQFVNGIGEEIEMYQLNDRGERVARRILLKRGHDTIDGCGAVLQTRQWKKCRSYPGDLDDLVGAIDYLEEVVEPPIRKTDHPHGLLVQLIDVDTTCLEFSQHIGWERHQQFGDPLQADPPESMMWLWETLLCDLSGQYQEIVLWGT